jgi:phosphatidylserine/phosphatidylglycerophosphate/cardiolipin synthase-like enzyme
MKLVLALALSFCLIDDALGDRVRIVEDPREASQIRVDLIQQAKHSIDAQYYIVGDDYFTYAGLALLRDAARRGCRVRVIIDGRSNKISPDVHAHLRQEKILVKIYHPMTLRKFSWLVRRMHDKGLDIDGREMIRGGRNVEGDYFGYARRNFVDRDVYVNGKAVADSSAYFDQLWNSDEVVPMNVNDPTGARAQQGRAVLDAAAAKLRRSKTPRLDTGTDWSARAREVGPVQFLHDPVGRKGLEPGISTKLRDTFRRARRSVLVETPYLVPTKELLQEIQQAKNQGVSKIEMITNSISSNDSMLVQLGYETSKKQLLRLGVDLWEYKGPDTLHAKSAVLDNRIALVGSFNIDPRSQHLNTETGVAINDEATARQLAAYINAHKPNCTRVTMSQIVAPNESERLPAGQRFKVSVLKALLPLLRGQL